MKTYLIIVAALMLIGCTHTVSGKLMSIKIKRSPACQVDVKMDGKLVFEGKAKKPCPKGE